MPRRQLRFQDFDSVARELEDLRQSGYTKVGKWDLSQVCEHLSIAMKGSIHGMNVRPAPWLVRKLVAPFVYRSIIKTGKMMEGIKVPDLLLPGDSSNDAQAVADCILDLETVKNHQGPFAPHPFFGALAPDEWKQLHLVHAAHHLSFLIPHAH